ncbi:hypothetical protein FQN54_008422 [Arachnomyces sp. PD_36]|nr:hypothetical protein FQN54_008422 [Arachnomyces sp. PD_36]
MKILDPQSATLTNIEVLAHLTANPPRRSPNPPPNARRDFTPKPDLRDHNTVVKEIHNYAARLSPHLLNYPKYTHDDPEPEETLPAITQVQRPASSSSQSQAQSQNGAQTHLLKAQQSEHHQPPRIQSTEPTDLDLAIREVITRLKPYGLTKAEVIMILNLGVGVDNTGGSTVEGAGEDEEEGEGENEEGAESNAEVNGENTDGDGDVEMAAEEGVEGEGEAEAGGGEEEDYGATVLLDTIIEDLEERLTPENVMEIIQILKETLGRKGRREREEGGEEEGVGV